MWNGSHWNYSMAYWKYVGKYCSPSCWADCWTTAVMYYSTHGYRTAEAYYFGRYCWAGYRNSEKSCSTNGC